MRRSIAERRSGTKRDTAAHASNGPAFGSGERSARQERSGACPPRAERIAEVRFERALLGAHAQGESDREERDRDEPEAARERERRAERREGRPGVCLLYT